MPLLSSFRPRCACPNGITGAKEEGFPYAVQAAFAVVDGLPPGTFIGPYGSVEGEVVPP